LRGALQDNDEREVESIKIELDELLYDINRQVRLLTDSEDEGFFTTLKKTLLGDDDEFYVNRDYRDYGSSGRMLPPAANNYDPYRPSDYSTPYPNSRGYDGGYNRGNDDYNRRNEPRRSINDFPADNRSNDSRSRRPPTNDGYEDRSAPRPRDDRSNYSEYPPENRYPDSDEQFAPRRDDRPRQRPDLPEKRNYPPNTDRRLNTSDNSLERRPTPPTANQDAWEDDDEWY
jgi:molecular chaperone DnaK